MVQQTWTNLGGTGGAKVTGTCGLSLVRLTAAADPGKADQQEFEDVVVEEVEEFSTPLEIQKAAKSRTRPVAPDTWRVDDLLHFEVVPEARSRAREPRLENQMSSVRLVRVACKKKKLPFGELSAGGILVVIRHLVGGSEMRMVLARPSPNKRLGHPVLHTTLGQQSSALPVIAVAFAYVYSLCPFEPGFFNATHYELSL